MSPGNKTESDLNLDKNVGKEKQAPPFIANTYSRRQFFLKVTSVLKQGIVLSVFSSLSRWLNFAAHLRTWPRFLLTQQHRHQASSFFAAHSFFKRRPTKLWLWGRGNFGQLGGGNTSPRSSPVQLSGAWLQYSGGSEFSIAQKLDGTWWTWG